MAAGHRRQVNTAFLLAVATLLLMLFIGLIGNAAAIKTADVTVRQAADKNWYTYSKKSNERVGYTGVANNNYGWWRVENGKVNFKAQSIYKNDYGWWKTTNGKVNFHETGVFKNNYGWWYVRDSKVDFNFTGIASNKNGNWLIEDGKVNFDFTGTFTYNGDFYLVSNGKAIKSVEPNFDPDETIDAAYDALNEFRTTPGIWYWAQNNRDKVVFNQSGKTRLKALSRDAELEEIAELRARETAEFFSHTRPDGTRWSTAYPVYMTVGENLVMEYTGSAGFATSLLAEEYENYSGQGHRRNMLNERYNCVGIACYQGDNGYYYWVQAFGRR